MSDETFSRLPREVRAAFYSTVEFGGIACTRPRTEHRHDRMTTIIYAGYDRYE